MFILKKIWCRAFQAAFRIALPFLPYREPEIISSCREIGGILKKEGIGSVLIVTDEGIVKNNLLPILTKPLLEDGVKYAVYHKTCPNPTTENVEQAFAIYNSVGCRGIIAIGGGSAMDCAKAVGVRVAYPKKSLAKLGGILKVHRPLPPLIAIPTTAGTGSETTLAALITDKERDRKYAIMSFPLIPRYAVLDPVLTYSLPRHLTATTGMDALTHAIEGYIGRTTTKRTRQLSREATALIFNNIEKAYHNGSDHAAREAMLHAAYKSGIVLSTSYVGYIHAIAHSLGGKYNTPHGLANAVILPHLLKSYGSTIYKKLHCLGKAAGVCTDEDGYQLGAYKFISEIESLSARLNIPTAIPEIKAEDIPALARHAEGEANPLYPVPKLMTASELGKFYHVISEK